MIYISGHIPLLSNNDPVCLIWNSEDVMAVLERHACVKVTLSGHTHAEAYTRRHGIHHLTLPGVVEVVPGRNGFGTISVYEDRIEVKGYGMWSGTLDFSTESATH